MSSTSNWERVESQAVRPLGALVAGLGLAITATYPASVVLRGDPPVGVPEPSATFLILSSAVFGPLLAIWGAFAVQHRTLAPLTVPRSLSVTASSLCAATAGLAAFTYEWARLTPFESPYPTGGPQTIDFTLLEIVRMELSVAHVLAVAAASAIVVGTATARRGWRAGLASAVAPAALAVLALTEWWTYDESAVRAVPIFVVLAGIPLVVGYVAASPAETTE